MNKRIVFSACLLLALAAPHLVNARWLSPQTGRFWTMDTFEGSQAEPLSLHKYLYARVDPVNTEDPTGKYIVIEGGPAFEERVFHDMVIACALDSNICQLWDNLMYSDKRHTIKWLDHFQGTDYWRGLRKVHISGNGTIDQIGGKSITFWDPYDEVGYDGKYRPAIVGLIHELRHAWAADQGENSWNDSNYIHSKDPRWDGVNFNEVPAFSYENLIRKALNLPLRKGYNDVDVSNFIGQ